MGEKMTTWVIDVGNHSTKLIKAKRDKDKKLAIAKLLLETEWTKKEVIKGQKSPFPDGITAFFKGYRKKDQVILLMADSDLRVNFWHLPFVDQDEVEAIIYWKMQELTADQLKNWHYDYLAKERVDRYKNLGIDDYSIDALTVVVGKDTIENYAKILKKNRKIYLNKILPQFYGIGKMLEKEAFKRVFFLDLGCFKTLFYDFKEGLLAYKMDMIPRDKETLKEYLKRIRRSLEDHIQLDHYKNNDQKPLLFLMGGGSLGAEVEKYLAASEKYRLGSLADILTDANYLKGQEKLEKAEMLLFFPAIAALMGE